MHQTARDLSDLASDVGCDPATLAVAWAMQHSSKPMPIISARDTEQLAPSLTALNFPMDDALYQRITALSYSPPPATDRIEEMS